MNAPERGKNSVWSPLHASVFSVISCSTARTRLMLHSEPAETAIHHFLHPGGANFRSQVAQNVALHRTAPQEFVGFRIDQVNDERARFEIVAAAALDGLSGVNFVGQGI